MSELKAFITREGFEAYLKSEADKVIADLEESHKMEVEQLLILNREQANAANRFRDSMEQTIRHQKYKRCLAMSMRCGDACDKWMMKKANAIGLGKDGVEYYHQARCKISYYMRWHKRWLELAEKFKEAK